MPGRVLGKLNLLKQSNLWALQRLSLNKSRSYLLVSLKHISQLMAQDKIYPGIVDLVSSIEGHWHYHITKHYLVSHRVN